MNKTVNVNIAGFSLILDEDAYARLKDYLDKLKSHFSREAGSEEIMKDIEARLAEMLLDLIGKREVVTMGDIQAAIKQMGMPEDFELPEDESQRTESTTADEPVDKRFYRDRDNAVLGGVCSGISAYFNVDPIWLRIAFVVGLFVFGGGLLLYLMLWIIMPEARTPAEKLRMRGTRVTISNIEKSFKQGVREAGEGIKRAAHEADLRSSFQRFIDRFGGVFLKLIGLFFVAVGIVMLAGMVAAMVGGGSFFAFSFPLFKQHFLEAGWQQTLSTLGIILVIGIPVFVLVIKGISALMNMKFRRRVFNGAMLVGWLAGLGMVVAVSSALGSDFRRSTTYSAETVFDRYDSDTLYVKLLRPYRSYPMLHHDMDFDFEEAFLSEDSIILRDIKLNVIETDDKHFTLVSTYSSRGRTRVRAMQRASKIHHKVELRDSILFIDPAYFTSGEPWRMQRVRLQLRVPRNKKALVSIDLSGMMSRGFTFESRGGEPYVRSEGSWM